MAKNDQDEKFVKFCQQCGSTNLKPWVLAQINPQYLCVDCDTIGFPIEGTEALVAAIQRKKNKGKKTKKSKNAKLTKSNSKMKGKAKRKRNVK